MPGGNYKFKNHKASRVPRSGQLSAEKYLLQLLKATVSKVDSYPPIPYLEVLAISR